MNQDAAPISSETPIEATIETKIETQEADILNETTEIQMEQKKALEKIENARLIDFIDLSEREDKLSISTKLFEALSRKHSPTAAHCRRVAMAVSYWSKMRNDSEPLRRNLEMAALLHDIGKLVVPDRVLVKPSKLTEEEHLLMEAARKSGLNLLRECDYSDALIDAVLNANTWFDGSKKCSGKSGADLEMGSRMIAIADAFDSMTNDSVYRRAFSCDRATAELFQHSSTQFDPELVEEFCTKVVGKWNGLKQSTAESWIAKIGDRRSQPLTQQQDEAIDFYRSLADNFHDGVVFVDKRCRITKWNRAMERMTGVSSSSVEEKQWLPRVVGMQLEQTGEPVSDLNCPLINAVQSGQQIAARFTLKGRKEENFSADLVCIPVMGIEGEPIGATMTVHDVSSKVSLEQRVEALYTKASQDPLTKVANRAELRSSSR